MDGWCDILDLFLYFWLSSCSCHSLRLDPGLDWLLICFSVAILVSMQFLSVIKNMHICSLLSVAQGQVSPFYSCKAVSLFLFQLPARKEGQALPYPSLAPTAASVGGRGKPQLPLEKKALETPWIETLLPFPGNKLLMYSQIPHLPL